MKDSALYLFDWRAETIVHDELFKWREFLAQSIALLSITQTRFEVQLKVYCSPFFRMLFGAVLAKESVYENKWILANYCTSYHEIMFEEKKKREEAAKTSSRGKASENQKLNYNKIT